MKTKILTLVVILGFATCNINAQGFVWAEGFGSIGDDVVIAHRTDINGNHYMAGYFSGEEIQFDNITLTNSNGGAMLPDLFLVKFDVEWNAEWAFSPENDQDAYKNIITSLSLDIDNNGNCYLTGSFRNEEITFGTQTLTNNSDPEEIDSFDTFIVKFNSEGLVVWALSIGNEMSDKSRSIVVEQSGDFIYISGWFYSETIEIGGITHYNNDTSTNTCDIFLAKYTTSGDLVWATAAGGDNIDRCQDMDIDEDGNIFLVGTFKGHNIDFGGNVLENTNTYFDDGFIVKYNPDGEVLLIKKAGGMLDEIISTIAVGQNGNFYLGGTFLSQQLSIDDNHINNFVQSGEATYDAFVAKYNNDNELVWLKRAGGLGNDALNKIAVDELDNVYITGGFSGEDFYFETNASTNNGPDGTFDMFIAMLNPYGNLEWLEGAGGISDDAGTGLIVEASEQIFVDCSSFNNINFGSISMNNSGGLDIYVAKFANNLNVLSGKIYYDINKNGIYDEGEIFVPEIVCELMPGKNYYITDKNGEFEICLEPGSYVFSPINSEFFSSQPGFISVTFEGYGEQDTGNMLSIQPIIDSSRIHVSYTFLPEVRKGQTSNYYLTIKNIGTKPISPIISNALLDGRIFNGSIPTAEVYEDSLHWSLPFINPFESSTIIISNTIDTTSLKAYNMSFCDCFSLCYYILGNSWSFCKTYCSSSSGALKSSQVYTSSNDWCQDEKKPLDPNDIRVFPNDSINFTLQQLEDREPLEYTIRFQNVGNDTCFNTVVLDTLSENLDISTFEMITASHNYSVDLQGRVLKFTFHNILLPDSTTNEPESHGFIKYRILPYEDLEIGDSITNRAYIYFDYEPAVITNTVCTKIGETLGVDENEEETFPDKIKGKVNIYPNPFNNTATVLIPDELTEETVFEIYDISGRKVKSIDVGKRKQLRINRDSMSKGIYIYMLRTRKMDMIDRGKMIIN